MITYVIFNQAQSHKIKGKTFDSDCVAVIVHKATVSGLQLANDAFGSDYLRVINEADSHLLSMVNYSRGVIEL